MSRPITGISAERLADSIAATPSPDELQRRREMSRARLRRVTTPFAERTGAKMAKFLRFWAVAIKIYLPVAAVLVTACILIQWWLAAALVMLPVAVWLLFTGVGYGLEWLWRKAWPKHG